MDWNTGAGRPRARLGVPVAALADAVPEVGAALPAAQLVLAAAARDRTRAPSRPGVPVWSGNNSGKSGLMSSCKETTDNTKCVVDSHANDGHGHADNDPSQPKDGRDAKYCVRRLHGEL